MVATPLQTLRDVFGYRAFRPPQGEIVATLQKPPIG